MERFVEVENDLHDRIKPVCSFCFDDALHGGQAGRPERISCHNVDQLDRQICMRLDLYHALEEALALRRIAEREDDRAKEALTV
jgi:hypothetical protein